LPILQVNSRFIAQKNGKACTIQAGLQPIPCKSNRLLWITRWRTCCDCQRQAANGTQSAALTSASRGQRCRHPRPPPVHIASDWPAWSCLMVLSGAVSDWRKINVSSISRLSVSTGNAMQATSNKVRAMRKVRRLPRSSSVWGGNWASRSLCQVIFTHFVNNFTFWIALSLGLNV